MEGMGRGKGGKERGRRGRAGELISFFRCCGGGGEGNPFGLSAEQID